MNLIQQLLQRRRMQRDLADEMRAHLDEKTAALMAAGMSPREARDQARRDFGNVTLLEEKGRAVWHWPIEQFFSDLRHAVRQLRDNPSFTAAVTLTLALGIGANTAVFSVVNAVLLRPLPFDQPERLVSVQSLDRRGVPHPEPLSYPNFFDFRSRNRVFEHLVSYRDEQVTLTGGGPAMHLNAEIVSWDLFDLLRVRPAAGRGFLPQEERPDSRAVVLSHELWQTRFYGDPALVGGTITLDGRPYTVAGVAPAGFRFPVDNAHVQVWVTLALDAEGGTYTPMTQQRGSLMINCLARLKPGVPITQAQAQMDPIASALAAAYPDYNSPTTLTLVEPELDRLVGDSRPTLLALSIAVGLLLLIACANMTNLLLARTADREREFAVRLAIGAGRGRVVRQLITENLLFAIAGSAAGVLLAFAVIQSGLPLVAESIPRLKDVTLDAGVLGFAIGLALLASIVSSLPPAWRVARANLGSPLQDASRRVIDSHERLRGSLVVAQISLGLVLLTAASLFAATFLQHLRRDPGFRPDHLLSFAISLPDTQYKPAEQVAFHSQLIERLHAIPGVTDAAGGSPVPLTGMQMTVSFDIPERPARQTNQPSANIALVTPGYFRAIGAPLLEGRDFTPQDAGPAPHALIVNRAFADKYFPGEKVLGRSIKSGAISPYSKSKLWEIVGVVGNAKQAPLSAEPDPIYYFPYAQLPWFPPALVVRTSVPPLTVEHAIRQEVASLSKDVPVYEVRTFEDLRAEAISAPQFHMLLAVSFAAIALLLTAVGLYGVLAYSVSRRTREIGVRVALGAAPSGILSMVLRRAMLLVAAGSCLGAAGALAGDRILRSQLALTGPSAAVLLLSMFAVVALTALFASFLPARRAAAIDPMTALRCE